MPRIGFIGSLAALVIVTAGCSGTDAQSSTSPDAASAKEAVENLYKAIQRNDARTACESFTGQVQKTCIRDWSKMRFSVKDYRINDAIVSGAKAFVSATGTSCSATGCYTVSDAKSGMPKDSGDFQQAWTAAEQRAVASNAEPVAAIRLVKKDGRWFLPTE